MNELCYISPMGEVERAPETSMQCNSWVAPPRSVRHTFLPVCQITRRYDTRLSCGAKSLTEAGFEPAIAS